MSKVGEHETIVDPIEYKEGGNAIIRKGLGRTKYDPITLERGITHDTDFELGQCGTGAGQRRTLHFAQDSSERIADRFSQ